MSLGYIIAAFCCGVLAASLGACQSFIMAGLIGIAGMGVGAAMNGAALASPEVAAMLFPTVASGQSDVMTAVLGNMGPVISKIAFDPMFAPAIAFQAPIWAGAYAKIKGYIRRDQIADTESGIPLLEPFRRTDILLVAGFGGVFGAVVNWFFTVYLGIGIDGHCCSIFATCIICKLLVGEPLISPVTDKSKGSRFSPNQEQGWFGFLSKASIRYTLAICLGACFAYAERTLMLNPITFGFAHVIGFLFGAVALIFLFMGYQVMVLPPITASACYVVKGMVIAMGNTPEVVSQIPETTFLLWGAAGGCIGITACHIMLQLFKAFSPVYIDPPGFSIIFASLIAFTVIPAFPNLGRTILFPVVILVLCLGYTLIEFLANRKTAYAPEAAVQEQT